MLSEAKHLYDCIRDPSLSLRVTICKVTCVTLISEVTKSIGNIFDLIRNLGDIGFGKTFRLMSKGDIESACFVEVHWYEARRIGKRDLKVKHILGK